MTELLEAMLIWITQVWQSDHPRTAIDPSVVFYVGMGIASMSLMLAFLVPRHPSPGHETTLPARAAPAAA